MLVGAAAFCCRVKTAPDTEELIPNVTLPTTLAFAVTPIVTGVSPPEVSVTGLTVPKVTNPPGLATPERLTTPLKPVADCRLNPREAEAPAGSEVGTLEKAMEYGSVTVYGNVPVAPLLPFPSDVVNAAKVPDCWLWLVVTGLSVKCSV